MLKKLSNSPLLQIHISVFLWGFTAILGKLIQLDTLGLVLLRMCIAGFGFYLIPKTRYHIKSLSISQIKHLALIGGIICIHWLCFYQSIKEYNSSSIALICLGSGPMFVLWIEYFAGIRKSITFQQIMISILGIVGMYFITIGDKNEAFTIGDLGGFEWAIIYGILASFLAGIFSIMNGKISNQIEPEVISCIEMISGAIGLVIFHIAFKDFDAILHIHSSDIVYILLLSVFCTCIPFLLSIYALKKLEPFIITLTVNLEPIYGLIFAAILFSEFKNFNYNFYIGSLLILFSVFLPLIKDKWIRKIS